MQDYLTLTQAAFYLGICQERARRSWPGWTAYGVKAYGPPRNIKFKKTDIDKLKSLGVIVK